MEFIEFNGWKRNVRLSNGEVELIVTGEVGPRVIRFGFIDDINIFAEIDGQQGGVGEDEWMIRGGHRFWLAPEEKPLSYELDNSTVEFHKRENGVKTVQKVGDISGVQKVMEIVLNPDKNEVRISHTIINKSDAVVERAPWALSVMATGGTEYIPMPAHISHADRLTHNQEWSLWGYTHFSDPRWNFMEKYITLSQDTQRGPTKLGIKHREGWVGYMLQDKLFVKYFACDESANYPDAGMNFETFTNEEFLEIESIGGITKLAPGESVSHQEIWQLHKGVSSCVTEDDIDCNIMSLVE
ncbi:MAG: hypothetical protein PF692_10635 [Kiritimatiellae bacterium]|jgi:hypothetical protein|nr:hypothetical protein [Kiritimatiellia bacterium]